MPNRDLKESNRRSPSLQVLSDAAERLWYRLITAVDDFGRMEADPEVVFTTCFQRVPKGWTVQKVRTCLQELAKSVSPNEHPLIEMYRVGNRWYLQLVTAEKHIYRRAKESKYPGMTASTMPHTEKIGEDGGNGTSKTYPERNQPLTEIVPHLRTDAGGCPQIPSYPESRTPNPDTRYPNPEPRTSGGQPDEPTQAQANGTLDSFTLTAELEAWSAKEGISNPGEYVEEFKDHWRSTGGKRKNGQAVKDWAAAFRNRLRYLKAHGKLKAPDWKTKFLEEAKT